MRRRLAAALLVVGLAPPALAEEPCRPVVEEHAEAGTATLRVHTDMLRECTLDEEGYRRVVAAWWSARAADAPVLRSLLLGRAIGHPWIVEHLAREALARDARIPEAAGDANRGVAAILSAAPFRARLDAPFAGSATEVRGVTVEKVLFDAAEAVLPGHAGDARRVPFDAQLWLVLGERR